MPNRVKIKVLKYNGKSISKAVIWLSPGLSTADHLVWKLAGGQGRKCCAIEHNMRNRVNLTKRELNPPTTSPRAAILGT